MKVDRYVVEDLLIEEILKIKDKPKMVEEVKNILAAHNIAHGEVQRIIDGDIPIENNQDIDDLFLCLLTEAIYKTTNNVKLNPANFFNEREIQIASRYQEHINERIKLPITIDKIGKLQEDKNIFLTYLDIQTLSKWNTSNLIEYNYETQRPPNEKVRRSGKIQKVADVDPKAVLQIRNHVLSGTFFPINTMVLNVLKDGRDKIHFDPKTMQLTILSGEIDIVDGFHRLSAFTQAVELNPDIELSVPVVISNLTLQEARQLVAQANTYNKLPEVYVEALKAEDLNHVVVNFLREDSSSDLKGRISPKGKLIPEVGHIVHQSLLVDEIGKHFEINTHAEANEIAEYLATFFNFIIREFYDDFERSKSGKTLLTKEFMFYGYIHLAKKMYDAKIPARESGKLLAQLNINEDNERLMEIVNSKRKINEKAFREQIINFFEQIKVGE